MKKILSMIAVLLVFFTAAPLNAHAAAGSASLTGPSSVRAGDKVTLTFNLNGPGLYGASGTLSYDANQLTMTGTKQSIGAPWMVEFNGGNMVAYDNNLSSPINGSRDLFTVSFTVKDLAPGTVITVSYTNVKASDGKSDAEIGTVSWRATVAEPLSANNALASLTVSNASISPAFSPDTLRYTAEVPFSVSKLDLKAAAADGKAKVSVSNPTLAADSTTEVKVTVTAENGAKKTYTIQVHREKDPNYVASDNNDLSEITVEGFLLSPVFRPDVTEYVVWLPYETESVAISGKASDGKAQVRTVGGENLAAGEDNPVKVICTAENGETKEYTVIVKRAAAHGAETSQSAPASSQPAATDPPVTQPQPTLSEAPESTGASPSATADPTVSAEKTEPAGDFQGIPWWWLLIAGGIGLGGGFACGYVVKKRKK